MFNLLPTSWIKANSMIGKKVEVSLQVFWTWTLPKKKAKKKQNRKDKNRSKLFGYC